VAVLCPYSSRFATATASAISRSIASSPRSVFKQNAKLHRTQAQEFWLDEHADMVAEIMKKWDER
jgi:hypothetical protein